MAPDETSPLYLLPVEHGYWERQVKKGLYPYVDHLLKAHALENGRILEVGCGGGRVLMPLARQGFQVTGVDFAQAPLVEGRLLAEAQQGPALKSLPIQWLQGDAQDLSFSDGVFDAVLLLQDFLSLFHDRARRRRILAEALRVLDDDGVLIVGIQNGWLDPRWRHFVHYLYCRLFVYPRPPLTAEKFREVWHRLIAFAHMKIHLKMSAPDGDVKLSRAVLDVVREQAPYHVYHLSELREDLAAVGAAVLEERDYLECVRRVTLPAWVRAGAPNIAIAARKKSRAGGRAIYRQAPSADYYSRQAQKGLQPYIGGMVAKWLPPPAAILEIGCEAGRTTWPLAARGYRMTALDIVDDGLVFGAKHPIAADDAPVWVQGDAKALPIPDGACDGVLLTRQILSAFHGYETRQHILHEARRVLKPGGVVFLSIQNGSLDPSWRHLAHYLYCRLFVYPRPRVNFEKIRTVAAKLVGLARAKRYLKTTATGNDVWITTMVSERQRSGVPFHVYHLDEIKRDLATAGFAVLDVRDFLEFEKQRPMPRWTLNGAPYLTLAARKT